MPFVWCPRIPPGIEYGVPGFPLVDCAITIRAPDSAKPGDRIAKVDIVKDGGQVVETYRPAAAHRVTWNPTIQDATNHYFFLRVWNECGGAAAGGDPNEPIAWLAPVWTGP